MQVTGQAGAHRGYLRFVCTHARVLSFGVLLTLFSSFGQTFLISLFVPRWLEAFALDAARFGVLYAGATLLSAASLPFLGRLLDRTCLLRFSLGAGLGLVLACLAIALAPNAGGLFLALFGLRLTGQGLLSLTASTTMARTFERGRGRALSLSGLGYPLGEGLLPLGVVLLLQRADWRWSWVFLGAAIALVLLPAMVLLLRPTAGREGARGGAEVSDSGAAGNPVLLRDGRFYALLPGSLLVPLVLTALFLYQGPLAESRGWPIQTMATAFAGFAVARFGGGLLIGPWIDRWGAARIFPFVPLPLCAGLLALSVGTAPWVALVYLSLAGVTQGIAGPTLTALWAEVYGVESLGAIKGTVATLAVLATALGPMALGALLAAGVPFSAIVPGCLGLSLSVAGVSLLARRQLEATAAPAVA
ncbi:MAG: MFS transporter [Deferrisomatales bacterium]|nr:MFS transporter [Deferrisomatales bacterium]